ncbi:MAG: phosphatase PAP2 family protein [Phycisphaerae bacterium]|nr:phosphatase PAP2 family protein [Phycisphaerae bacterium]
MWIGLIVLGSLATAASYLFLDPMVSTWFLSHPSTWHRNIWVDAFRQLGKADVPIWLLVVWSCLTDRWRPTILTVAAMILVGASVCPLKAITRRSRPDAAATASQQNTTVPWQKRVSFPSGDAAVVFAGATTLSFSLGRLYAPALFAAAGVIGLLRVTVSAHYPSDVLAGATIGVLCGLVAIQWMARRRELDQFRVEGRWRLSAGLVLILVIPFVGSHIGMRPLQIFLKVYILPLAILALVSLYGVRRREVGQPGK